MLQKIGQVRHKMSQYEELVQVIRNISNNSETKSYELIQYAENIGRFIASFSSVVNGTNDWSAKDVYTAFLSAQKELYKAAKASMEAAQAGYDWCGDTQKTLVLKKVR